MTLQRLYSYDAMTTPLILITICDLMLLSKTDAFQEVGQEEQEKKKEKRWRSNYWQDWTY